MGWGGVGRGAQGRKVNCPAARMRYDGEWGARMPTVGRGDRPALLGGKGTKGAEMETKQNQDVTPKLSVDSEAGVVGTPPPRG